MSRLATLFFGAGCVLAFALPAAAQQSPQKESPGVALRTCATSKDPVAKADACTQVLERRDLSDDDRKQVKEERGVAFVAQGKFREGLTDLAYATTPRELSMRAEAYMYTEAYEDAIVDLNEVIKIAPDYTPQTYNALGWADFKTDQLEKGLTAVNRALELDPKFAEAYDTRAHIYWAMARNPELLIPEKVSELGAYAANALKDYRKALELKPDLQESIRGLAEMGAPVEEK